MNIPRCWKILFYHHFMIDIRMISTWMSDVNHVGKLKPLQSPFQAKNRNRNRKEIKPFWSMAKKSPRTHWWILVPF
ncbi:hypothetical protein C5K24_00595 [Shigella boydii]|uniref:Uncharacterized protein n=1 Tax=Shigella dysenteriae TaxID=622 RepID=A0A2S8DF20_SHIDY|nr:hypothetical protein C5K26_03515 [Shigella flexneri]PQN09744.1 hypothetical protein C5K18_06675 [Shigella dysenteriae]PQN32608.1 hypothetical protein C5K23_15750 [Shigella boydii]PQN00303.1 hypothetical protein C5K13_23730 [Shigella flexneri]PQN23567.1 hypothetical protein C5K27_09270 [Shigella flexneri]